MSTVYFIQGPDRQADPIKIGISVDPESRLRQIQTGSPVRLSIIHLEPGGRAREALLHRRWARHRMEGEWFQPAPDILDYLAHAPRYGHPAEPGDMFRVLASPIVGLWRIVVALVLWVVYPPARRRRSYRGPAGLGMATIGAGSAAIAYYGPDAWWIAALASLAACTVAGMRERR